MLTLAEAVEIWLRGGEKRIRGSGRPPPRRALFLGAGFTKSAWRDSPLFSDFKPLLVRALRRAGALLPELTGECMPATPSTDVGDLIELVDHLLGRLAVARVVMAEPGGPVFHLEDPMDPQRRPPNPRSPSAFRRQKPWWDALKRYPPGHLSPLDPKGPVVLLGRLIAEGAVCRSGYPSHPFGDDGGGGGDRSGDLQGLSAPGPRVGERGGPTWRGKKKFPILLSPSPLGGDRLRSKATALQHDDGGEADGKGPSSFLRIQSRGEPGSPIFLWRVVAGLGLFQGTTV